MQECGNVIVSHVVQGNSHAINQHPCGKQVEQCFPLWWSQLEGFLTDNRSPHAEFSLKPGAKQPLVSLK